MTESAPRACGPLYTWRQPLRGGCREGGQTGTQVQHFCFFFSDVPSVFAVFVKNKQNARDIRKKRGKSEKTKNLPVFKKFKKPL